MTTRAEAQQRVDQIQAFKREVEALKNDAVLALSADQTRAVDGYHATLKANLTSSFDVDPDSRAKQLSLGMRIASLLGALSLAASVFFFFYKFWGALGTTVQVGILVGASLASFAFTIWLRSRDATGYFAKLAAMVAFACFVLNISMLGQIFNVTPSDNALIAWAALAAILAYGCDSRLLLVAAVVCFAAFIAARVGTWAGLYWIDFGQRPENFFPAALLLLLVPQFTDHRRFEGFAGTYRVFGLLAAFGPLLLLANWGDDSYLRLDRSLVEGGYQVAGFIIAALAIWFGVRRNFPEVINTSVTFFVVLLYTKFYDWWWKIMPKYLFFLVLGLTAILFLSVLRRLRTAGCVAAAGVS